MLVIPVRRHLIAIKLPEGGRHVVIRFISPRCLRVSQELVRLFSYRYTVDVHGCGDAVWGSPWRRRGVGKCKRLRSSKLDLSDLHGGTFVRRREKNRFGEVEVVTSSTRFMCYGIAQRPLR